MKFTEYRYERPDAEQFKLEFTNLLKGLETGNLEEQKAAVAAMNELRSTFDTMQTLVSVRHSINTEDEFYKAEQDYMDEIGPVVQEYITDYYRALVNSKYRV
jgi:oligoendopeptidase F